MNKYLRAFFVGSSFFVLIWPFLYLGIAFTIYPESDFQMGIIAITIPFIYGFANVITIFLQEKWPPRNINTRMWILGATLGLILSLHGNFLSDLPRTLFQLSGPIQYITIPFSVIVYSLVWRYIVKNFNEVVGL